MNETGDESTECKDSPLTSLFDQCLGSVRRLAAYAQEAQRDGSFDLAEFFRRAQAEARRPDARADATRADAVAPRGDQIVADDPSPVRPSHDEIAQRAFSIYQREGGDDKENWERAERELMEHAREAAKREPDPPAPGES
jgi:hypothetical protein